MKTIRHSILIGLFFGLVATVGTYYVQTELLGQGVVWFAAALVGLYATALLLANNLRDIETDRVAEKRTLAVRLGRVAAGRFYIGCVAVPFAAVIAWSAWSAAADLSIERVLVALLPLLAAPLVLVPTRIVASDASGRALLPVLAATARVQLVFGVLLAASLCLWIR